MIKINKLADIMVLLLHRLFLLKINITIFFYILQYGKYKSIEFEIIKEPWNKYQIIDNSVLKTRTVLKKIERIMDGDKVSFSVDAQTLTVIYADSALKGTPKSTTNY